MKRHVLLTLAGLLAVLPGSAWAQDRTLTREAFLSLLCPILSIVVVS